MARFKEGDKVRWRPSSDEVFTVVSGPITAIHEWSSSGGIAYVIQQKLSNGGTHTMILGEAELVPAPKPFTVDGHDRYLPITTVNDDFRTHGSFIVPNPTGLGHASVIKIDGQTGELSWVKGGPNA